MMGEIAELLAALVAIVALLINICQFKKAREVDRNEIQKNAAYCVNAWIEVKEGGTDFYNLYICNNSSSPVRNVKIVLIWNGEKLNAPTINTYPIIPTGNFVTTYLKKEKRFTYLKRVETVQEYSPICIETLTNKYKVLKLEFIDTFSIKWTRNYDLNQSGEEDLIRNNN